MLLVKSFGCGLLPLRTGCIVIAILSIVICIITYGYNIAHWHWAYAIGLVFELSVWTALLLGTILNNHMMVLASFIGLQFILVMRTIVFVVVIVRVIEEEVYWEEAKTTFMAIAIAEFIIVIPIYVYWSMVIHSFYRSLKHNGFGIF